MHILRKLTQNAVKATAAWLDISLILQLLLAPALFVLSPQPVIAATEPQVAFSYNADASEFSLQVEPIAEVDYTVTYTTSHGITDGFQDGGSATDGVYRATRIAGTTSSEHDTHYGVEAGSIEVVGVKQEGGEFRFERDFTIQNGQLVWDFETVDEPGYWSQVELGQTYQAVEDSRVSITFTQLPDPTGDLRIRQVELSDEQVANLGALTNIAYEITSSMEDGTFAYDLTLPNPQPEKKATIQYSEDGTTFNDAGEEEHFADTVTVRGLDHFTLFVVTLLEEKVEPITPILECVIPDESGSGFTAYFGYNNPNNTPTTQSIGLNNRFTGGGSNEADRGQTTIFNEGLSPAPYVFSVYASNGALVWHLSGNSISANKNSEVCGDDFLIKTLSGAKFNDQNGNGEWDENESGLEGWTIKAVDPNPVDSLEVLSNNYDGDESITLPAGDYLLIARGDWTNRNNTNERYDAEYGTLDNWTSHNDGLVNGEGEEDRINFGDLWVNGTFQEWGPYNGNHEYLLNVSLNQKGTITSSIFDGPKGSNTKVASWYGDNSGAVSVDIYRVIDETTTGADGSYNLDIPPQETNVRVFEIPQRGWTQTYPANPRYHELNTQKDALDGINFGNQADEIIAPTASVTVCKEDPNGARLNDWRIAMLGDHVEDVFVPNDGSTYFSNSLDAGNYAIKAMGTHTYWPSAGDGAGIADAGYSLRPEGSVNPGPGAQWIAGESLGGAWSGYLKLQINNSDINWGPFTPDHTYFSGMNYTGGNLDFRILDSGYGDNSGGLTAAIYHGWVQETSEDGCTTFEEVPYGEYTLTEGLQDSWTNVTPLLQTITIDEDREEFTLVNVPSHQLATPVTLGWNVKSISNNHSKTDVDLVCTEPTVYTNGQPVSHVWTEVSGFNIKYQRQNIRPNGSMTGILGPYSNAYSGWGNFGAGEGKYETKVRAWSDWNNNGKVDGNEPVSEWSDWCVIHLDTTAPKAPQLLTPPDGFVTSDAFTQTWTNVSDGGAPVRYFYESCYDDICEGSPTKTWTNTYNGTSKYVGANQPDSHFWWHVKAIDAAGNESPWSQLWELTIDSTAPDAPEIISPLHETHLTSAALTQVDWTDVLDLNGPVQYRYQAMSNSDYTINRYLGSWGTNSFIDTPNTPEGKYWLRVKARDNALNESAWSNNAVNPHLIVVDDTPPVSSFDDPEDGDSFEVGITINGQTSDNYSVDEVTISYAPYTGGACSDYAPELFTDEVTFDNLDNSDAFTWPTYNWMPEPGAYCLTAHGVDLAGNVEKSPVVQITYDPKDILSGYKFHDLNQNGEWDEGEPVLEGWTINASVITRQIVEGEGQSEEETTEIVTSTEYASDVTDENGYYEFEVPVGEYEVSETQQEGWDQTAPTDMVCSFDVTDPNKLEEDVQIDEEGRYTCNFGNYLLPVPTPTPVADLGGGNSNNNGGGFSAPGPADPPVCSANAPGIPVGLSVTNATANTVTLNWTRPEGDVTHYALEFIRLSDGARYGAAKIGDGNTTSYTITNLSGQAAYRFELMAVNDCKPGERAVVTSTQITGPVINEADAGRPQGDDGQVLGSSTDETVENADGEIAGGVSDNKGLLGSVLGASTENCSVPGWWWLILVGYVLGMIAVYALLEKRARLVGAIVVTLAAAAGLYWTLCMPWIWIAIIVAASILVEGGRYLLAGQGKDPFKSVQSSTKKASKK